MKLTVLNLNAWLLPFRLSAQNGKRLHTIFDLIRTIDPDIITLQEVWDISYLRQLKREFGDYSLLANTNKLFNESGLITFSRYPVIHNKLHRFKTNRKYKLLERLVKKGFMVTTIDVYGKEIDIVNTHLYQSDPFSKETHKQITRKQLLCLQDFFKKSTRPVLACGDFNIHYDELKLQKLLFTLPNGKSLTTVSKNNEFSNKKFNKTRIMSRQLDYFMYKENGVHISVTTKVFDELLVSDHYPLYAEVTFGTASRRKSFMRSST